MKKNLLLFGVLVVLLIFTYFFQEKRAEKEYVEAQTKDRIFQEEIVHLKLPHVEAEKKDGQWWEGKQLLSHNTFRQIETKLSEIKKIKEIEGEKEKFLSNAFVIEVNGEEWKIGDLSLDRQGFYLTTGDKIYLVEIVGESHELTQDPASVASIKLKELLTALSKQKEELKETQLFRFYPKLPMEKVVISVQDDLPFELNFEDNMTSPPPIKGINVHQNLQQKFSSLLTQMTLIEEVPYPQKKGERKLAQMDFIKGDEKVSWEMWLMNKNSADALIIDNGQKRAFKMIGGTLKIFFVRLQDYWDKKVIPPQEFKKFSKLPVTFIEGSKKALVQILNREPLSFETPDYKVNQENMEKLTYYLFNLGPMDQGDRVSNLSSSEKKQLLSEEHLRIEVLGQELILWRKAQELIVANLTQGFKVHFTLTDENFPAKFQDVLN